MSKKLYVGNLPYSTTESKVKELFMQFNPISVKLINDKETGRPRGFGFVELEDTDISSAITSLNGKDIEGRALVVNEAREREPRQFSPRDSFEPRNESRNFGRNATAGRSFKEPRRNDRFERDNSYNR